VSELVRLEPGRRRPRPLLRTLIGDVLRRERQGQRRTLADVAREARVSVPYLSEVERGRKEASSEVLAAVCVALRIDLSDLLAEARRDLVTADAAPAPVVKLSQARHRTGAAGRTLTGAAPTSSAGEPVRRAGDVMLLAA
jgi:transcriptional regulator with XRE-family HTH domain